MSDKLKDVKALQDLATSAGFCIFQFNLPKFQVVIIHYFSQLKYVSFARFYFKVTLICDLTNTFSPTIAICIDTLHTCYFNTLLQNFSGSTFKSKITLIKTKFQTHCFNIKKIISTKVFCLVQIYNNFMLLNIAIPHSWNYIQ